MMFFSLPQISRISQKACAITVLAENISVSSVSSVGENPKYEFWGENTKYWWENINLKLFISL